LGHLFPTLTAGGDCCLDITTVLLLVCFYRCIAFIYIYIENKHMA